MPQIMGHERFRFCFCIFVIAFFRLTFVILIESTDFNLIHLFLLVYWLICSFWMLFSTLGSYMVLQLFLRLQIVAHCRMEKQIILMDHDDQNPIQSGFSSME